MADKKVKFYLVYLQDNDERKINTDMSDFFRKLEDSLLDDKIELPQIYNGKRMYLFEYSHPLVKDYSEFVIPFGKRKTNTPYKKSEKNIKAITEETEELFDVNLLYYSKEYDAAIITADKDAPNNKAIESFLNCFLNTKKYKLRIKPILYSDGIEKVRKSEKVRSICIYINLDPAIQNYYDEHINSSRSLMKGILQLVRVSKTETKSKSIKLELGMGHYKSYMDFQNAMALLNELELADSDIIKEVKVNYYDGHSEKIETTKLRKVQVELTDKINQVESGAIKISRLLEEGSKLLEKHLYRINEENRNINENSITIDDDIELYRGGENAELQTATV